MPIFLFLMLLSKQLLKSIKIQKVYKGHIGATCCGISCIYQSLKSRLGKAQGAGER